MAAAAARAFGGEDGCPSFLCGDLNTFDRADMSPAAWEAACAFYAARGWPAPAPRSLVCATLEGVGYTDAFRDWQRGHSSDETGLAPPDPPPLTCWSHQPLYRLDYVYLRPPPPGARRAGARLRATSHRTVESDASDHFAVTVDLEWSASEEGVEA